MHAANSKKRLRSFIAFTLPSDIITLCTDLKNNLIKNNVQAKWTKKENLHITIKFLGNEQEKNLLEYTDILSTCNLDLSLIKFKTDIIRTFSQRSKILFLNITDNQYTAQKNVKTILEKIEHNESDNNWVPHITIGRFRNNKEKNSFLKRDTIQAENLLFKPESISIFTSTLTNSGPIYKHFSKIAQIHE
ncbi:MAG TPA: RNA 2',3'-cyclic phosphodiesterase [Victivallales bacterium]|nr:RNA 2',3'-cyclic phosphodiesterase [Victivallales bacterium]